MLKIISEIHPQHGGNMDVASEMIRQSALNGADMVKFQWYEDGKLVFGKEYSDLELSFEDCKHLVQVSEHYGVEPFFSIFDEGSLEGIKRLGLKKIKIASRTVVQFPDLCKRMIDYADEIYVSLGMWDKKEFPFGVDSKIHYFFCIAKYPTYHFDLKDIPSSYERGGIEGYSDHTLGIDACLLAAARGAFYVEKHFTLDKTNQKDKQLAHACSMSGQELYEL
jgi:sialic acid synthase SpsE